MNHAVRSLYLLLAVGIVTSVLLWMPFGFGYYGWPWHSPAWRGYMPHLTVGDGEHLSVRFVDGRASTPGVPARFVLELMYHPAVCDDELRPGVEFAVREDNRIIAIGRVVGSLPAEAHGRQSATGEPKWDA